MRINFIRHGKTAGNIEKRFIGSTDEPLCAEGINELDNMSFPDCDLVITSPMTRCIQTARLIYPSKHIITYSELRECSFGNFEGKTNEELDGDPEYMRWLASGGGLSPFPGGENVPQFRTRCVNGFLKAVNENRLAHVISFVVHGGTIMSVLSGLAVPEKDFYEYKTDNGHGFIAESDGGKITILKKI